MMYVKLLKVIVESWNQSPNLVDIRPIEAILKDAETPITEEWLVSIGFVESKTPMGEKKWSKTLMVDDHDKGWEGGDGGKTTTWMVVHDRFEDGWWPMECYQQHSSEAEPGDGIALIPWHASRPTTRGDLICLWDALKGDR